MALGSGIAAEYVTIFFLYWLRRRSFRRLTLALWTGVLLERRVVFKLIHAISV